MPKYTVRKDYAAIYVSSDGEKVLKFKKGQTLELGEEMAAWVNRDCAGTLEEAKARAAKKKETRQVTEAENRGGRK